MVGVSDIVKILDQVPIWKTVKNLPKRVEDLEKAVANLQARLENPPAKPGDPCPACGEFSLRRTSSKPMKGDFEDMGVRSEVWTCEACGETDERIKVPS